MSITQRGNTNLPGEVRFDSAGQVLKAWAMVDGALVTPTSATVTLYSPGGAVLVAATAATVGSELTYTLDASDEGTWVLDEGYTARWDYTIASVARVQEHLFDVVLRPILANIPVTVDDLKNADPSIDAMLSQSSQSTDAHQRYIQSAWVDVYAWIKSKGRRPWLIADSRVLYRVTKARALELLCRSSMMSPGDKYGFLAEVYEKTMLETDQIADAPTIEILETIVRKTRRHIAWGQEVLDRLCDTDARRERRRARAGELRSQLIRCGGVTGDIAPGTA